MSSVGAVVVGVPGDGAARDGGIGNHVHRITVVVLELEAFCDERDDFVVDVGIHARGIEDHVESDTLAAAQAEVHIVFVEVGHAVVRGRLVVADHPVAVVDEPRGIDERLFAEVVVVDLSVGEPGGLPGVVEEVDRHAVDVVVSGAHLFGQPVVPGGVEGDDYRVVGHTGEGGAEHGGKEHGEHGGLLGLVAAALRTKHYTPY